MSYKVAIVEDVPSIAQMYKFKLEALGYKVETARNGKLGLELIETYRPDIVLVDLMMPEISGDEMISLLRKKDYGKDMKVFMLSNVSEEDMPTGLGKLGIDRFIVKTEFTPGEVAELVKAELEKSK